MTYYHPVYKKKSYFLKLTLKKKHPLILYIGEKKKRIKFYKILILVQILFTTKKTY